MDEDKRRAREEANEVIWKIRRQAELLRSVVAETQEQVKTSRELLARASPRRTNQAIDVGKG
jgi:hypothetical protein